MWVVLSLVRCSGPGASCSAGQRLCLPPGGHPLLADAFICVLRRYLSGQPVFEAHRLHLYQRLHQAGWSHSRVSLLHIGHNVVVDIHADRRITMGFKPVICCFCLESG